MQFADKDLALFWDDLVSFPPRRVPPSVRRAVYRTLQILDAASKLDDLRIPPGKRLEDVDGSRSGQRCVRISDQWRLCFTWESGEARGVEFCGYHI